MRAGLGVNAEEHRSVTGAPVYVIPLGFTTPPLSLNGRYHWRTRNKLVQAVRAAVVIRGRQLRLRPAPHLHVRLHYVPRDRRHRDPDNLVATLKPAIDALTSAGRDRGWPCLGLVPDDTPEYVTWSTPEIHDPDVAGPRMWLEVTVLTDAPPAVEEYGVPVNPTTKGSDDARP